MACHSGLAGAGVVESTGATVSHWTSPAPQPDWRIRRANFEITAAIRDGRRWLQNLLEGVLEAARSWRETCSEEKFGHAKGQFVSRREVETPDVR